MNDDTDVWGVENSDELPELFYEELPRPLYWRILVMPIKPKKQSKGGIALPMESMEVQKYLNYMGKVVALGPLAGRDSRLTGRSDGSLAEGFPKVGDHVIYGRYAGQRMTYKNVQLLTINDDEILEVVPNPDALRVYVF